MTSFVCEVCGWSDGEHAPDCGLLAFIALANEHPEVRREHNLLADAAFLRECGIDTMEVAWLKHKNEALRTALGRAVKSSTEDKRKPSPQELEERVLQFLNALLGAFQQDKPE